MLNERAILEEHVKKYHEIYQSNPKCEKFCYKNKTVYLTTAKIA